MIRTSQKCPKGHAYTTIKPTNYQGKAQFPPSCPHCKT